MRQVVVKSTPKTDGLYEVNLFDHMNAKVDSLYQKIDTLSIIPSTPIIPTPISYVAPATLNFKICKVNGHTDRDCQMILTGGSTQENEKLYEQ